MLINVASPEAVPSTLGSRADDAESSGAVPSLFELCCRLISSTAINLDNAPFIVEFSRDHNVPSLRARAEKFCCDSWRGLSERHDRAALVDALGAEVVDALIKDQLETDARLHTMRLTPTNCSHTTRAQAPDISRVVPPSRRSILPPVRLASTISRVHRAFSLPQLQ